MNWKEFKTEVERQMEVNGISQEEELFYIDCGLGLDGDGDIYVAVDPTGVVIS